MLTFNQAEIDLLKNLNVGPFLLSIFEHDAVVDRLSTIIL